MMAVTLFCQDAREEVGGTISLIGVLPDNVNVDRLPAAFPKLVIYTRINLPAEEGPKPIGVSVRAPAGDELTSTVVDEAMVRQAFDEAFAQGNSIAGVITRIDGANFPAMEGRYLVVVKYGDQEAISGSMMVRQTPR